MQVQIDIKIKWIMSFVQASRPIQYDYPQAPAPQATQHNISANDSKSNTPLQSISSSYPHERKYSM
jgi:hypothetical protein